VEEGEGTGLDLYLLSLGNRKQGEGAVDDVDNMCVGGDGG
jgi:hypothetical protein